MMTKLLRYFLCALLCQTTLFLHATTPPNFVIATIGVGLTPNGIAITPDGLYAYVANNNNNIVPNQDTVSVISTTTNTVVATISDASFNQPYTVSINPAGTTAYVTNSNSSTVTIIDIATNTVTGTIIDFDGPSGMAISPDGTTGWVNNYGAGFPEPSGFGATVSVVDLTTNVITDTINVQQAPSALAITPNGAFVYVTNYIAGDPNTGTISVIQTSDNTILTTISASLSGPFAIAITPNGNYAYITNFGSNNFSPVGTTVTVVNLNTNTVTATIPVGVQPSGVAITPDGNYVYISNYNTLYLGPDYTDLTAGVGTVNIISTATNSVILPTIIVGSSPAEIAITPNGKFAYVTNFTSNNVSVIGIPQFTVAIQGCKTQNIFLTQEDLINKLTWSVSGVVSPVSYSIYRDPGLTDFVATIPATPPLIFLDHNRAPNIVYTYYIIGTDSTGTISYPVAVTVTQNC